MLFEFDLKKVYWFGVIIMFTGIIAMFFVTNNPILRIGAIFMGFGGVYWITYSLKLVADSWEDDGA